MGIANAQRTMDYIRIITEFISQPQYKDVVPMFGIINEALVARGALTSLYISLFSHLPFVLINTANSSYLEAHNMIRGITGIGEGNGAFISIHDGFAGLPSWAGFLPNSDRIALDTHPYFAFSGSPATDPIDTGTGPGAGGIWPADACGWGRAITARYV
jgi:glucan 1,3-beta-glucosidase